MNFSPQTQKIYKVLLNSDEPKTVAQLAAQMKIVVNSTYRLIRPLVSAGLVQKISGRPSCYLPVATNQAHDNFLIEQSAWFIKHFTDKTDTQSGRTIEPNFIKGRDSLMEVSVDEIDKCNTSIDLLRSGHEMPTEVMLSLIKALDRGVVVRMLIQDYNKNNCELVSNWKKNGISVRVTDNKRLRLMIFDSIILYFMSYKHSDSDEDIGMRLNYQPLTVILSSVYGEMWDKSKVV